MQPQLRQPTRSDRVFWVGLGITIALTLGLAGVIIWLLVTQNLAQLSVLVGLIASIVAIISAPFIFYFTVFKKPEKQEPLLLPQKTKPRSLSFIHQNPSLLALQLTRKISIGVSQTDILIFSVIENTLNFFI